MQSVIPHLILKSVNEEHKIDFAIGDDCSDCTAFFGNVQDLFANYTVQVSVGGSEMVGRESGCPKLVNEGHEIDFAIGDDCSDWAASFGSVQDIFLTIQYRKIWEREGRWIVDRERNGGERGWRPRIYEWWS